MFGVQILEDLVESGGGQQVVGAVQVQGVASEFDMGFFKAGGFEGNGFDGSAFFEPIFVAAAGPVGDVLARDFAVAGFVEFLDDVGLGVAVKEKTADEFAELEWEARDFAIAGAIGEAAAFWGVVRFCGLGRNRDGFLAGRQGVVDCF